MIIRKLEKNEYAVLETFLYESIFQKDPEHMIPRSEIEKPQFQIYLDDYGKRKGDHDLVAEVDGAIVGAVWTRIVDGFGNIDSETPEFVVSVLEEQRGKGVGTSLMIAMLELLKKEGYQQVSLACQKENYAVKMYQNVGFEIIGENEEEYIFLYKFQKKKCG